MGYKEDVLGRVDRPRLADVEIFDILVLIFLLIGILLGIIITNITFESIGELARGSFDEMALSSLGLVVGGYIGGIIAWLLSNTIGIPIFVYKNQLGKTTTKSIMLSFISSISKALIYNIVIIFYGLVFASIFGLIFGGITSIFLPAYNVNIYKGILAIAGIIVLISSLLIVLYFYSPSFVLRPYLSYGSITRFRYKLNPASVDDLKSRVDYLKAKAGPKGLASHEIVGTIEYLYNIIVRVYLFRLYLDDYWDCLCEGRVEPKLRMAFQIRGYELSPHAKLSKVTENTWQIGDYQLEIDRIPGEKLKINIFSTVPTSIFSLDRRYGAFLRSGKVKKEFREALSGYHFRFKERHRREYRKLLPTEEHLFSLDLDSYCRYLKSGTVDSDLRKAFNAKLQDLDSKYDLLSDSDSLSKIDRYWWRVGFYGFLVRNKDLKVYKFEGINSSLMKIFRENGLDLTDEAIMMRCLRPQGGGIGGIYWIYDHGQKFRLSIVGSDIVCSKFILSERPVLSNEVVASKIGCNYWRVGRYRIEVTDSELRVKDFFSWRDLMYDLMYGSNGEFRTEVEYRKKARAFIKLKEIEDMLGKYDDIASANCDADISANQDFPLNISRKEPGKPLSFMRASQAISSENSITKAPPRPTERGLRLMRKSSRRPTQESTNNPPSGFSSKEVSKQEIKNELDKEMKVGSEGVSYDRGFELDSKSRFDNTPQSAGSRTKTEREEEQNRDSSIPDARSGYPPLFDGFNR